MKNIDFIKMHGLGNDFVIIDSRLKKIKITKKIINKLSDRKTGAGCDQVILIRPSLSDNVDAIIEIFNPNGDRAEACGNGTRCVAKLLFQENKSKSIKIKSDAGILHATKNKNNISVNLGKISTEWKKIPISKKVDTLNMPIEIGDLNKGIAVNIGNPHIIFFKKNIKKISLELLGPIIENHKLFPEKTNVEIVKVINKQKIRMRVWERGVGLTLACGSGACASVYAGVIKNKLKNNVNVLVEKGTLNVKIINEEAILTGPAEISYKGNIKL